MAASTVIHKLKATFARHGIPDIVTSNNVPQYKCKEFEAFGSAWEFTHLTISPHYPQSNDLPEKSMQIAKSLIKKAKADHTSHI